MSRSWTDPRTGIRWRIQAMSSPSGRGANGAKATAERPGPPELVFKSDDASYSVPAWEAVELETLGEERLVELLDEAKRRKGRKGKAGKRKT